MSPRRFRFRDVHDDPEKHLEDLPYEDEQTSMYDKRTKSLEDISIEDVASEPAEDELEEYEHVEDDELDDISIEDMQDELAYDEPEKIMEDGDISIEDIREELTIREEQERPNWDLSHWGMTKEEFDKKSKNVDKKDNKKIQEKEER